MSLTVFGSPRLRRRLAWTVGALVLAAAAGAASVALPSRKDAAPVVVDNAPVQVVRIPREVTVTEQRKRAIDRLLDAFVPTAVERKAPLRAYDLVTPAFRAGTTRAEWRRGNLPVLPFDARGTRFHGWTLDYAYAREMSVDILIHPSAREELGPIAFTAVFKKRAGRWLIDSFVPAATFAPRKKSPEIKAAPDFTAQAWQTVGHGRLDAKWLLVPAGVLALILLAPVGIGVAHWRRSRRIMREYRAAYNRGT